MSNLKKGKKFKALTAFLDTEILRHSQKWVELLLRHIHLPLIHKVEDGEQLLVLDTLQVEEGVLVRVPPQDLSEEWTAGRQNHLKEGLVKEVMKIKLN